MKKNLSVQRSMWFMAVGGILLGALIILGIRFANYHPEEKIHYHANFAIFINGQQEQFKDPIYYTEVEDNCAAGQDISPHERAHMHDNINDVVHVEDQAVTWGNFFQNIFWVVDYKAIRTPDQLFLADEQNKVTYVLNGKQTDNLINRVIEDQDKLLVDFGSTSSDDLDKYYKTIPATAQKYNVSQDPASCGSSVKTGLRDRLNHLF